MLKQPGGNVLLVGLGGSGRQSITRLASFMSHMTMFQPEISKSYGMIEWRDDLKMLMKNAGVKGQKTVFLLTDTQIKDEAFLEDIDSVLNTGEVPNLFAVDEKQEIMEVQYFLKLSAIVFFFSCDLCYLFIVFSFYLGHTPYCSSWQ